MKSRLLVAAVAFLGYAILDATPANAVPKYAHSSGDWSGANVWCAEPCDDEPGLDAGEPEADEDATICEDVIVTVSNASAVAMTVTLESPTDPGTTFTRIDIDPNGADAMLTLGSGEADLESVLEGDTAIYLVADASYKPILRFETVDHTVMGHVTNGEGDIVGEEDDAQIELDDVKLTSQLDIRGRMHITDALGSTTGTLDNQGRVMADAASGTLDIETSDITDTNGSDRWQVIADGAKLQFSSAPSGNLAASFTVSGGGQLWIGENSSSDIDVITTGDLTHTYVDSDTISRIVVNGALSQFVVNSE